MAFLMVLIYKWPYEIGILSEVPYEQHDDSLAAMIERMEAVTGDHHTSPQHPRPDFLLQDTRV